MHRSFLVTSLALLLVGGVPAQGQQSTERYIPIGRSPGLSGVSTSQGRVERLDATSRTLDVEGAEPVVVPEHTRIWLDRSARGQTNLTGKLSDLQPGRWVEVSYRDPERHEADWIKIRID